MRRAQPGLVTAPSALGGFSLFEGLWGDAGLPGTRLPERRGEGEVRGLAPRQPLLGEAAEGRKCRALTSHFHRDDGRPSPEHPAAALGPGCSCPGRVAVATLGVTGLCGGPSGCPAMLWYQPSPTQGRAKLSHGPAPAAALGQTHPRGSIHGSGGSWVGFARGSGHPKLRWLLGIGPMEFPWGAKGVGQGWERAGLMAGAVGNACA